MRDRTNICLAIVERDGSQRADGTGSAAENRIKSSPRSRKSGTQPSQPIPAYHSPLASAANNGDERPRRFSKTAPRYYRADGRSGSLAGSACHEP